MTAPSPNGARFPYEWIAPCLFLFILPITHTTPGRTILLAITAIGTALAFRGRTRVARPSPAVCALVLLWAAFAIVASWTSIEPDYSWGEFRNEVLQPLAAFLAFLFLTASVGSWRTFRDTLLASAGIASLVALVGYFTGSDWGRQGYVGDRNAFSTYVVLIFPLILMAGYEAWSLPGRTRRSVVVAIGVLALVAAMHTQNRNMWFSIALECLLFSLLVWWRQPAVQRRAQLRRLAAIYVVGLVLLGATMTYVIVGKAKVSNLSVESQARVDQDPRFEIWHYAAGRIGQRPWTGYGFGRGILRKDFRAHFDNILKWHGHNMVVNYAIEGGVAGAVLLVALFASLVAQSVALYRSAAPGVWVLGAWTATMIAGIALKVMTDDVLIRENSLLFWSCLGMAFGLGLRWMRDEGAVQPGRKVR